MKKSKLAKKAKGKKVVARRPAPRKQVAKKRAVRKAAPKAAPVPQPQAVASTPSSQEQAVTEESTTPPGSHLDAPAAGPHPGAGHQSVVRSEVKS